ncbi:hypothetical protein Tco_0194506 [Tanacetum coccineum]
MVGLVAIAGSAVATAVEGLVGLCVTDAPPQLARRLWLKATNSDCGEGVAVTQVVMVRGRSVGGGWCMLDVLAAVRRCEWLSGWRRGNAVLAGKYFPVAGIAMEAPYFWRGGRKADNGGFVVKILADKFSPAEDGGCRNTISVRQGPLSGGCRKWERREREN